MKHERYRLTLLFVLPVSPAHGLLRDVDRNHNERAIQGPPGPPGPPGNSRLFGSHANVTDLVEYMKSKDFTKRKDEVAM